MHFLYQIVTSMFIYSLYEEEGEVFLHALNLKTKESEDIFNEEDILNILTSDPEVSPEDYETAEELVSEYRHC